MKKLLLDTTYFLPLIGIEIEGINSNLVEEILNAGEYTISLSEISLFELAAKGAKIARKMELTYQDVLRGIDTIKLEKEIRIESWTQNQTILEMSFNIRALHSDYADCIIAATAICSNDILATYDETLVEKIAKDDLNPRPKQFF
ncbi:MAG: PIN domain-containing protein [Candidatus Heimdallarchaeota archaeon]